MEKLELLYTVMGPQNGSVTEKKNKSLVVLQKVKTENYYMTHSQVYIQN